MTPEPPAPAPEVTPLTVAKRTLKWLEGHTLDFGDHIHFSALDARSLAAEVIRLTAALAEATPKGEAKTEDDIIRDSNPSRCPFTNRPFFMVIEHPERGSVATYGGPYDSYTLPEPDDMDRPDCDHVLRCERFDHDAGHWVEGGDPLGLEVVTNRELSDLYEFKYRVEEVAGKARAMDEILNAACAGKGVEVNLRTGRVAIPPVRVSRELANWLLDVLLDRKPAAILDAGAGKGEGKQ